MIRPLTALTIAFLSTTAAAQDATEQADVLQPFPGVTVDRATHTIELTGRIAVDANAPETPEVVLELIAETGGVRDHEAIVTLDAEARHVHAALLLLGLEPGEPGRISFEYQRIEPTGPRLLVSLRFTDDGEAKTVDPTTWIINRDTGQRLSDLGPAFVFGGSMERDFAGQPVYMAEAEGTVVGLCTFATSDTPGEGYETVGMIPVFDPDSESGDPIWIAEFGALPPADTPVTLVLTATAEAPAPPDRRPAPP